MNTRTAAKGILAAGTLAAAQIMLAGCTLTGEPRTEITYCPPTAETCVIEVFTTMQREIEYTHTNPSTGETTTFKYSTDATPYEIAAEQNAETMRMMMERLVAPGNGG